MLDMPASPIQMQRMSPMAAHLSPGGSQRVQQQQGGGVSYPPGLSPGQMMMSPQGGAVPPRSPNVMLQMPHVQDQQATSPSSMSPLDSMTRGSPPGDRARQSRRVKRSLEVKKTKAAQNFAEVTRETAIVSETTDLIESRDAVTSYLVQVYTADKPRSGTNSKVIITLIGDKGKRSGPHELKKSQYMNMFERGQVDDCQLENVACVGAVVAVEVQTASSGFGFGFHSWLLSHVVVTDLKHSSIPRSYIVCDAEIKSSDKERTGVHLFQAVSNSTASNQQRPLVVDIFTSDTRSAGTDHPVKIGLLNQRNAEEGQLTYPKGSRGLNRGKCASRVIANCCAIENIHALTVFLDGKKDNWHMKTIVVTDMATGVAAVFEHGDWVEYTNKTTIKCSQRLKNWNRASLEKEGVDMTTWPYKLIIRTTDVMFAGTDAEPAIRLIGNDKHGRPATATGILNWHTSLTGKRLARSGTDTFYLDCDVVHNIDEIQLWTNGAGTGAGWHVMNVTIVDQASGSEFSFTCGQWLHRENDYRVQLVSDLIKMKNESESRSEQVTTSQPISPQPVKLNRFTPAAVEVYSDDEDHGPAPSIPKRNYELFENKVWRPNKTFREKKYKEKPQPKTGKLSMQEREKVRQWQVSGQKGGKKRRRRRRRKRRKRRRTNHCLSFSGGVMRLAKDLHRSIDSLHSMIVVPPAKGKAAVKNKGAEPWKGPPRVDGQVAAGYLNRSKSVKANDGGRVPFAMRSSMSSTMSSTYVKV